MGDAAALAWPGAVAVRLLTLAVLGLVVGCGPDIEALRFADLEGARAVFLENIAAIQTRDKERYLSHYLDTSDLVAASPEGLVLGYASLAAARRASDEWPDSLVATEPTLVWLAPGVVYGAYRYAVRQWGAMSTGWSERVLVKTGAGWKIAVTSVLPATP